MAVCDMALENLEVRLPMNSFKFVLNLAEVRKILLAFFNLGVSFVIFLFFSRKMMCFGDGESHLLTVYLASRNEDWTVRFPGITSESFGVMVG